MWNLLCIGTIPLHNDSMYSENRDGWNFVTGHESVHIYTLQTEGVQA